MMRIGIFIALLILSVFFGFHIFLSFLAIGFAFGAIACCFGTVEAIREERRKSNSEPLKIAFLAIVGILLVLFNGGVAYFLW